MKKLFLSPCLILFFITRSFAQTSTPTVQEQPKTPVEFSKRFFEIYSAKPFDAIDYIFSGEKTTKQLKEDITAIKKNLKATINLVGDFDGYELITEKSIGNSFKLMSYMVKYDRQPIRFIFIYYKPKDAWKVYTFQFNTNLDDELGEAARVDRLKQNKE